jgi:1-acyl-sn-glycerol-3-phosphate acyltransferase
MPDQSIYTRGRLSDKGLARLQRVFAFLYGLFATIEVRGQEHIPPGGVIITPNHLSRFDPPLVFMNLPRPNVTAFNADTYRRNPFFRWVLTSVDVIWVNRGATSPATIKAALQALRSGRMLGVAPEGTRSPTGALIEGKTGAAFLALAAGVPIVPCAVTGVEKLGRAITRLRRIKLTVSFGPAFMLAEPGARARKDEQQLAAATTEIMCRIALLLPPQYRGVYADHPRLRELLSQAQAQPELAVSA